MFASRVLSSAFFFSLSGPKAMVGTSRLQPDASLLTQRSPAGSPSSVAG